MNQKTLFVFLLFLTTTISITTAVNFAACNNLDPTPESLVITKLSPDPGDPTVPAATLIKYTASGPFDQNESIILVSHLDSSHNLIAADEIIGLCENETDCPPRKDDFDFDIFKLDGMPQSYIIELAVQKITNGTLQEISKCIDVLVG